MNAYCKMLILVLSFGLYSFSTSAELSCPDPDKAATSASNLNLTESAANAVMDGLCQGVHDPDCYYRYQRVGGVYRPALRFDPNLNPTEFDGWCTNNFTDPDCQRYGRLINGIFVRHTVTTMPTTTVGVVYRPTVGYDPILNPAAFDGWCTNNFTDPDCRKYGTLINGVFVRHTVGPMPGVKGAYFRGDTDRRDDDRDDRRGPDDRRGDRDDRRGPDDRRGDRDDRRDDRRGSEDRQDDRDDRRDDRRGTDDRRDDRDDKRGANDKADTDTEKPDADSDSDTDSTPDTMGGMKDQDTKDAAPRDNANNGNPAPSAK